MGARIFDFDDPLPRSLYWDASFLVHATYSAGRYHRECFSFLDRLSRARETLSYISSLALDEALYTLLRLKVGEDHPNRNFWDLYREDAQIIQPYLPELRALVDRLTVDPRLRFLGTEPGSVHTALDHMDAYALLPRDAWHLSVMAQGGVRAVVTTDEDFLPVDGLTLFTCNPRILDQR